VGGRDRRRAHVGWNISDDGGALVQAGWLDPGRTVDEIDVVTV
jgi:hypothetical protein